MSSKWTKATIADVLELVIDHRGKTPKKLGFDDFHCSGYQVLSAKHVKTSGLTSLDSIRYANESMYNKWMKVPLQKGDVILTSEAPMGETYYIDGSVQYLLGQRVFGLRPKQELIEPLYLLSWLSSQVGQSKLKERATGSTVQGIKQSELLKVEIELPPLFVQRAIAVNQSSISEKIQLNSKINQTLEQMAQAIFKSWFVDFEPVKAKIAALEAGGSEDDALLAAMQAIAGSALFATDVADADAQTQLARLQAEHPEQYTTLRATAELFPSAMQESELGEIPEGWEAGSIGDVATARGGYAFKGSQFEEYGNPVVKIKNIVGDGTVKLTGTQCVDDAVAETAYRFQLNDGDLVMAMTGATVGKTGLVLTLGEKVLLNQRVAVFQSKYFGSKISWFLFCLFARKDIFDVVVGTAQGSAQPNISSSGIEAVPIVVPAHEVLEQYLSVTDGLFKFWLENNRQSENLSSLRDTLLPKLLSGELSLAVAEEQLADTVEPAHV